MTVPHTYSVRTWDTDEQAYTPQAGLSLPWQGLTLWQLKAALRESRKKEASAAMVKVAK